MYLKEGPQSFFVGIRPRVGRVSDTFLGAGAGGVGIGSRSGRTVLFGSRLACLFRNLHAASGMPAHAM